MKKIININLSGRVIPIEDSAYESLQRYIDSLRRYFAHEEGRDEIINDIESRIAELMNDKVKKGAAAVTDADIEEIIQSMGRVEDFEQSDIEEPAGTAGEQSSDAYTQATNKRFKGRLYRDSSDKFIGGVCSGIASYMNVDPAIVRLLFAIITFGGFGMGFLLYILLWIIVPAKDLDTYIGKRLFRNPEDRIFGGVAGGLAAYFNKQAWAIRLIFAAPLALSIFFGILGGLFTFWNHQFQPWDLAFGSLTGTFILIYIVLWIVLPMANSSFEKMEMRGEKVDVNRIRQNVKEEMNQLRKNVQEEVKQFKTQAHTFGAEVKDFASTRSKAFAAEFSQTAKPFGYGLGHAIGVIFKAFFLFIAGSIAFALFVVVLVFILGGVMQPFNDFLLNGFWQKFSLWGVLIFFLAVPLIAIITWMVRRLMKVRSQNRYLGWIFGGMWFLGFISLGIFITTLVRDFRYNSKAEQEISLAQPAINKLAVKVNEPEILYSGTFDWIHTDGEGFDITEDSLFMANVRLDIAKSNDDLYHVTISKSSGGENRRDAMLRAEKITYSVSTLDSTLLLGSGLAISRHEKFRGQYVRVEIKVPVGKKIFFDESVEEKLHPSNVQVGERRRWNNHNGWDDWDNNPYDFNWRTGVDYIMTEDGSLEEADKYNRVVPTETDKGVYEYKKSNRDSLRRAIDEKERELQQEKERLRQLEKTTHRVKMVKTKTEATARTPLPSFSFFI